MSLSVGDTLPEIVHHPTTRTLVKYAGASGDFNEQHYDLSFAQSKNFSNVIVHGLLETAWLADLVVRNLQGGDRLMSLDTRYLEVAYPSEPYTCRGAVRSVTGAIIELEVWGENSSGRRCATAIAVIARHSLVAP